jgi:hypothetical protein
MLDLAASYQFNDYLSWEMIRFGLPIYNHDTNLNDQIEAVVQDRTNDNALTLTTDDRMK